LADLSVNDQKWNQNNHNSSKPPDNSLAELSGVNDSQWNKNEPNYNSMADLSASVNINNGQEQNSLAELSGMNNSRWNNQ
jgi:hypothetical protein